MGMQVDEAGRGDQPGRVEHLPTRQPSLGRESNSSVANANVAHSIETRFRVDDASAVGDEVELRQTVSRLRGARA
jgi:hypothetical protein